ncbi:MAG TPA: hypothetical protein DG753_10280 [Clostridium sp.]|nr:hypothetical protein [Clostridium sp.]
MKNNKKKVFNALIAFILFCAIIQGINYCIKNSTRNILVQSLYNSLEYGKGEFDQELLVNYNARNIDKLNKGKELAAEDYFLMAFEYCTINKDREEALKYAAKVEEKKGIFTNRYVELYSEFLIDYYYTYIQKDDDISKRIDEELSNITIRDWNKYSNLLNSKLALFINFDGGLDYIMNKAEELLKNEEKLEAQTIVIVKDTLVAVYKQKGYHAKVLEKCMELKALLEESNVIYGDAYRARAQLNEAEVYAMLSDNEKAEELLKEALEMNIENKSLNRDTKVTILNDLISIYFIEGDMDEILDLINKYKDIMKDNDAYNSDVLYYLSMAQYHMEKYEKDRSSKEDLSKAEEYIKLSRNCFTAHTGAISINISKHQSVYETYLEYLKGNVDYALNKYNELLNDLVDRNLEIDILQKNV